LWVTSSHKDGAIEAEIEKWDSLAYVDEAKKDSDAWYSFSTSVRQFNVL